MRIIYLFIAITMMGCNKMHSPDLGDNIVKTESGYVLLSSDSLINFKTLKRNQSFKIFLDIQDWSTVLNPSGEIKGIKAIVIQFNDSPNSNKYDTINCIFSTSIESCGDSISDIQIIDFAQTSKEISIMDILGAHIYVCFSKSKNKFTGFFLGHPNNRVNGKVIFYHATTNLIYCGDYTPSTVGCRVIEF